MSEQDGPREIESALRKVEGLSVRRDVELGNLTRFGIGGPADVLAETDQPEAFAAAVKLCRRCSAPFYILGDGTNVIVSDAGYRGVVLRFTAVSIKQVGEQLVSDAGAALEALVDAAIEASLKGLETLARIPGSVGAARRCFRVGIKVIPPARATPSGATPSRLTASSTERGRWKLKLCMVVSLIRRPVFAIAKPARLFLVLPACRYLRRSR